MAMVRDRSPSDLHTHLGYQLRIVSNAISQSFARKIEAEAVTVAEWVFLRMLYDVENIAPSQLSERMGMTRGAISKLADRLVEKSLIDRFANPNDKRAHTLALKKAGRALVPRLAKLADKNDAEFFGVLSSAQRQKLEQLLRKIALNRELTNIPID
jgi:DNA-binding MarR family transcriptional regulator